MSGMWSWFGGASQGQKRNPKQAIIDLREQLGMLQKREEHLRSQIDEQQAIVRKNVMSNKIGELSIPLYCYPKL